MTEQLNIANFIVEKFGLSVQTSRFSNLRICSIFPFKPKFLLSESVTTGMDKKIETAYLKAVTEFVERRAFLYGKKAGNILCQTTRSDGFAAFPIYGEKSTAIERAKENAINEAFERFAWATWWDRIDIEYSIEKVPSSFSVCSKLSTDIEKKFRLANFWCIQPAIENFDSNLVIFLAQTRDGFTTGGAAGKCIEATTERALGELLRHLIAGEAATKKPPESSMYIDRLMFFYSGRGNEIVKKRLSYKGSQAITIPNLQFSGEVEHQFESRFVVYRGLFEKQPAFINSDCKRLCI